MKRVQTESRLTKMLFFGLVLFSQGIGALQQVTDDLQIGSVKAPKYLDVTGQSKLAGAVTIGSSSVPAEMNVYGPTRLRQNVTAHADTRLLGNTTVGLPSQEADLIVNGNVLLGVPGGNDFTKVSGDLEVTGAVALNAHGTSRSTYTLIENFDPQCQQLCFEFYATSEICPKRTIPHGAFVDLVFCGFCVEKNPSCPEGKAKRIPVLQKLETIYIHPTDPLCCRHFGLNTAVDEWNCREVSPECLLEVVCRKDCRDRICLGLAILSQGEEDEEASCSCEPFFKKQTPHCYEPGMLFVQVTSCNVKEMSVRPTIEHPCDCVPDIVAECVSEVVPNDPQRSQVCRVMQCLGKECLAILEFIAQHDHECCVAVVNEIVNRQNMTRKTLFDVIRKSNVSKRSEITRLLRSMKADDEDNDNDDNDMDSAAGCPTGKCGSSKKK